MVKLSRLNNHSTALRKPKIDIVYGLHGKRNRLTNNHKVFRP